MLWRFENNTSSVIHVSGRGGRARDLRWHVIISLVRHETRSKVRGEPTVCAGLITCTLQDTETWHVVYEHAAREIYGHHNSVHVYNFVADEDRQPHCIEKTINYLRHAFSVSLSTDRKKKGGKKIDCSSLQFG